MKFKFFSFKQHCLPQILCSQFYLSQSHHFMNKAIKIQKIKNETLRIFYHLEMLFEINLTFSYCGVLRYIALPLEGHLKNHAPFKA